MMAETSGNRLRTPQRTKRTGRRLRPHHDRRVNRQPVQLAAASTARLLARGALAAAASRTLVEGRPASVRCLVHAGRLLRRTRRQILQPCKLVLDGLMLTLQLRQSTAELLILCPQTPNLANQLANHPNQVRLRQTFERIRDASCHPPSLNHIFEPLTPPPPGNSPRLHVFNISACVNGAMPLQKNCRNR